MKLDEYRRIGSILGGRETNHPELPAGEIQFILHVEGAEEWSWANIQNNGAATNPGVNPWNEMQDQSRRGS